jgi:tRNA (guanine37-N1)-methyltransferase
MQFHILTLFPEMVENGLQTSILGRAIQKGLIGIHAVNIRDYTQDKHNKVDDYPYGGGAGMLMQAQPVYDAWKAVAKPEEGKKPVRVLYMSPQGKTFSQEMARELAQEEELIFLCGHYEGIDERVIEEIVTDPVSIGDYVLTGGELASLVVADSVLRLQPGVLAEEKGYQDESYWDGLLEYPQFTRPEVWEGRAVPPMLLTGDHKKIDEWRGVQSRERTRERRPDLYDAWCESHPLTELPKWKRGENMRLVKNDEQLSLCAALMAEGRRAVCEAVCTEQYLEMLTPQAHLPMLQEDKKNGWAFYLHYTKDSADGMVGVCHKTGEIGRLFVTEAARGRGYGAKMLDFARKKLPEHPHPTLGVLNTNTRAIALYKRMGWRLTGSVLHRYDPADAKAFAALYCEELEMRYQG